MKIVVNARDLIRTYIVVNGIQVYKVSQEPGTIIITFPKSFHCGFGCGVSCTYLRCWDDINLQVLVY